MTKKDLLKEFPEPPFGITILWGQRKSGKTIGGLNSLWQPVHVIDVENSAKDYEANFKMCQDLGLIKHPFTRASCLTFSEFGSEAKRIIEGDEMYGTIQLDTIGQITEWIKNDQFGKNLKKSEKMSQVVWGEVRDRLRDMLLKMQMKCKLIILTAHQREYPTGVFSPRANPAILELASVGFRLIKGPNQKIPDGITDIARVPVFPPRIQEFSIEKLLGYYESPADWDNLSDDEKVEETAYVPPETDA